MYDLSQGSSLPDEVLLVSHAKTYKHVENM